MSTQEEKIKKLALLVKPASKARLVGDDYRSTGIVSLDLALGTPGYRNGRIIEIFGVEHSGKTLIALHAAIWEAKHNNKKSLFIDAEGSFDPTWYTSLGGDLDMLDLYDPFDAGKIGGEEIFDDVLDFIEVGGYSFVIVDSLIGPALLSHKILDKNIVEEQRMGVQAKLNKEFLSRAFLQCVRTGTTLLITNHLVDNVGVTFGPADTTPGGKFLKFMSEQRIRVGTPKHKQPGIKHTVDGTIVKNKRAPTAGIKYDFTLNYKNGVDNYEELWRLLLKKGITKATERQKLFPKLKSDFNYFIEMRNLLVGTTGLFEKETDEAVIAEIKETETLESRNESELFKEEVVGGEEVNTNSATIDRALTKLDEVKNKAITGVNSVLPVTVEEIKA